MTMRTCLIPAVALIASISAPVFAADLNEIIQAPMEEAYVPVEIGSGWYIRGDLSFDLTTSSSGTYRTYDGVSYSTNDYDRFELPWTGDVAVGMGYQFNSWLRADATVGYWQRNVNGTDTSPTPCLAFAGAVGCRSEDSSRIRAWELMANGYADLGTYIGITPYIGAGAGFAHFDYNDLVNRSFCTDAAGADIAGCGFTATHSGVGSWRFAWALMAGASVDLTKNTKLDLGYRYARYGGGDAFGWDAATAALGATGVQGKDNGFNQHQIKAGIRYALW